MFKTIYRVWMMLTLIGALTACNLSAREDPINDNQQEQIDIAQEATSDVPPTETLPPFTPLPSLTPSQTLRPPPTFEPPTRTPTPTEPATPTATPTVDLEVDIPGLQGLWTDTPEPGEEVEGECVPRDDWELRYEVQPGDAVANIAPRYNIYPDDLAEGNCLEDPSLIRLGQVLRVPGDAHPQTPDIICRPWELLTPFNGAVTVPGEGTVTFNWRGPEAPRFLVRLWQNNDASGSHLAEYLVEFRNDYTLDLTDIPDAGTYSWRVYPLGRDFRQVPCDESHYAIFTKAAAPPTPSVPQP